MIPGFPREKILTISATEYTMMVGKKLSDYEPFGIYSIVGQGDKNNLFRSFVDKIPENAEIVVDFVGRISWGPMACGFVALGTALIPKEK